MLFESTAGMLGSFVLATIALLMLSIKLEIFVAALDDRNTKLEFTTTLPGVKLFTVTDSNPIRLLSLNESFNYKY
jgi:hypothetical protein